MMRTALRRALYGWLTPRGLAARGLACIAGFAVLHALGLASTLSVLSLTPPTDRDLGADLVMGMLLYVLAYILATVAAPILLLASALLATWNRLDRRGQERPSRIQGQG